MVVHLWCLWCHSSGLSVNGLRLCLFSWCHQPISADSSLVTWYLRPKFSISKHLKLGDRNRDIQVLQTCFTNTEKKCIPSSIRFFIYFAALKEIVKRLKGITQYVELICGISCTSCSSDVEIKDHLYPPYYSSSSCTLHFVWHKAKTHWCVGEFALTVPVLNETPWGISIFYLFCRIFTGSSFTQRKSLWKPAALNKSM